MSTATKLQKILDTKSSIKKALQDKGLTVDDVFSNYPDKVNSMIYKIQISSSNVSDIIIQYLNNVDVLSCKELFKNSEITEAPLFDTSNITDMSSMFYYCNYLTTVPLYDTSNVTDMSYMFGSSDIELVPLFDTSNVTDMRWMFQGCSNLTTISEIDMSNVTSAYEMFQYCQKLTTIPLFNTSNVTDMSEMFYGCNNLTTISKLDMSSVTSLGSMFYNCSKLSTINILNLGKQQSVTSLKASSTIWGQGSDEALQSLKDSLITNSFDRKTAGYSTMTIYLSTATKALLTNAEKAQITAKGYTIA